MQKKLIALAVRLNIWGRQAGEFIDRRHKLLLWCLIGVFVSVWSAVTAIKYFQFGYNALDLAIYTQVVWNSAQGRLFEFSIHHQSYLGDHMELALLLLVPFFKIIAHPLTLVVAQISGLALAAWPVHRLALRRLGPRLALFVSAAYLLNPFVLNSIMYEFHFLAFAPLVLFAALDAYEAKHYARFAVFSLAALLVREDVALVIMMFSVLAALDRRHWRWAVPGFLAVAWLAFSIHLTGTINPNGQYKYLTYYSWLGPNLPAMLRAAITRPWIIILHLFSWDNLNYLLGLMLPFAFLPLLKRRGLWLAAPILLQLLLFNDVPALILQIHYQLALLPGLFYGFIPALAALTQDLHPGRWAKWARGELGMSLTIVGLFVIYSSLVIGPAISLAKSIVPSPAKNERLAAEEIVIDSVPKNAGLASGFAALPAAAQRTVLSSLHYVYLGHQQYTTKPFVLPADTRYILIDQQDFLMYHALYRSEESLGPGSERLRQMIIDGHYGLVLRLGDFMLLQRNTGPTPALDGIITAPLADKPVQNIGSGLSLWGLADPAVNLRPQRIDAGQHQFIQLSLDLALAANKKFDDNLAGEIIIERNNKTVAKYPGMVSPFYPTTAWTPGQLVSWHINLLLPAKSVRSGDLVRLTVQKQKLESRLNEVNSITPRPYASQTLGTIVLGTLVLP